MDEQTELKRPRKHDVMIDGVKLSDDGQTFESGTVSVKYTVSFDNDSEDWVFHTTHFDISGLSMEYVIEKAIKPAVISQQSALRTTYKDEQTFVEQVADGETHASLKGRGKRSPKDTVKSFYHNLSEADKQEFLKNPEKFLDEWSG